jgi:hypothetical protein
MFISYQYWNHFQTNPQIEIVSTEVASIADRWPLPRRMASVSTTVLPVKKGPCDVEWGYGFV